MRGEEKEEKKEERERKITRILTDEKLLVRAREKFSAINAMLQNDYAIDCLFLLYLNGGGWKEAREFMRKNGKHIIDGTFRSRMIDIVRLKLATRENMRPRYTISDLGKTVAELLLGFFEGSCKW